MPCISAKELTNNHQIAGGDNEGLEIFVQKCALDNSFNAKLAEPVLQKYILKELCNFMGYSLKRNSWSSFFTLFSWCM